MSVSVKAVSLPKRKSMNSWSSLENIGPAGVLCFGDASFCQHVVTHIDKDVELLKSIEVVALCSVLDSVEDELLSDAHGAFPWRLL